MKWFLQFLSVGGVVIYTLLVITDDRVRGGSESIVVRQTPPNQSLSAWGPHLPNRSKEGQFLSTTPPAARQNSVAPEEQSRRPGQHVGDEPKNRLAASTVDETSLPHRGGTIEPTVASEDNDASWFVVSRAARLHAGPSVSSPVTHFFPVGTELKLIDYVEGWFQVSDPATTREGWIYEKYYLQALSGPGETQVAMPELLSPTPTRVAYTTTPKPKPVSRVKKPRYKQKVTKPKNQQQVRIARAREYKPFRGYY